MTMLFALAHHLPEGETAVWRLVLHAVDHVVVWAALVAAVALASWAIVRALARGDEPRVV